MVNNPQSSQTLHRGGHLTWDGLLVLHGATQAALRIFFQFHPWDSWDYLVGGWALPLWKIWFSQLGRLNSQYDGTKYYVPNHQPAMFILQKPVQLMSSPDQETLGLLIEDDRGVPILVMVTTFKGDTGYQFGGDTLCLLLVDWLIRSLIYHYSGEPPN